MNKYQESIDKLRSLLGKIAFLFGYKEDKGPLKTSEELNKLQELVDKVPYYEQLEAKAIPFKPLNQRINHNGLKVGGCKCLYHIDNHRSTNTEVDETYNFCKKCGQKLDWSKDDQ